NEARSRTVTVEGISTILTPFSLITHLRVEHSGSTEQVGRGNYMCSCGSAIPCSARTAKAFASAILLVCQTVHVRF
ncbi:MAG: hypothetical protein KAI06_05560, partial [Anaerolineales bacterium]|nr:hypothetical protein [Anaerolineales bacterium]